MKSYSKTLIKIGVLLMIAAVFMFPLLADQIGIKNPRVNVQENSYPPPIIGYPAPEYTPPPVPYPYPAPPTPTVTEWIPTLPVIPTILPTLPPPPTPAPY